MKRLAFVFAVAAALFVNGQDLKHVEIKSLKDLDALAAIPEWRRGSDTNGITMSVCVGNATVVHPTLHTTARYQLARDLTFDSDGRLVRASPVCIISSADYNAKSNLTNAANRLERTGLPRNGYQEIGEAFKKTGTISSPSEEQIRFMDALAQDLSKTISMIDGVVDARVHVVLPENNPFTRHTLPSSAAVAIRARWDADTTDIIPSVKELVKNAIEGLEYEKIMVTVFRDSPPKKK